MEVQVAAHVATLLLFDAPLTPSAVTLPADETRLRVLPLEEGTFILVPSSDLLPNEQVPLTVEARDGTGRLRFSLVTRREVDIQVHVVRIPDSAEEDAAELLAHNILDMAENRPVLVVPQRGAMQQRGTVTTQIDSVLWMGRRLFVTLFVRHPGKGTPPWRLVQVRLRATLPDGVLLEWPARLLTGSEKARYQHHVFTSLMPDGAEELELALDGEDAAGAFHPVSTDDNPTHP